MKNKILFSFAAVSFFSMISTARAYDASKAQQCAVDLCGPSKNYQALTAQGAFGDDVPLDVKAFLKNSVNPQVTAIFSVNKQVLSKTFEAAQKLVQDSPQTLTPEQLSAIYTQATIGRFQKQLSSSLRGSSNSAGMEVDTAKFVAGFPTEMSATAAKVAGLMNALMATEFYSMYQIARQLDFDTLQMYMVSQGMWAQFLAVAQSAGELEAAQISNQLRPTISEDLLMKAATLSALSDKEKAQLLSFIQSAYKYAGPLQAEVLQQLSAAPIEFSEYLKFINWEKEAADLPASLAPAQERALKSCGESVARAIAASPSPLRLRKTLELLEQVKAAGKKAALSYFTGQSLTAANQAIDEATFLTPPTLEATNDKIAVMLDKGMMEAQAKAARLAAPEDATDAKNSLAVAYFLKIGGDAIETSQAGVNRLCESVAPQPFEDHALVGQGQIYMGWQSAIFPKYGAHVLAHELGHLVSYGVRKNGSLETLQNYTNVANCSTEVHKALDTTSDAGTDFTKFAEEDWADAFGTTTIKNLTPEWPYVQSMGCALIGSDADEKEFKNLQLYISNSGDSHSTSFLRTLQLEANLGRELPTSCKDMMTPSELQTVTRTCSLP